MKNSRKSQIAVIIGLAITIILSFVLFMMNAKWGFPSIFFTLCYILSYILFIIAVGIIMYYIAMSKNKIISITISVVAIIIDLLVLARYVTYHTYGVARFNLSYFLRRISAIPLHVFCGGIFFALLPVFVALLVTFISDYKSSQPPKEKSIYINQNTPVSSEIYCSMAKHVLLLLFTFGIWYYIWIYRMTGYTNAAENEEYRNPTKKLLLCLFVPFYIIYWTYKTAQRVDKMAAAKGISSDMATLCLILAIFVPIIPPILLQDKMNNIATANDTQYVSTPKGEKVNGATLGTAEELKNFKELLDSGVITQDEFEAKKKQLLGL